MMEKATCPICGKSYDAIAMDFLENGNPACLECVAAENAKKEKAEETQSANNTTPTKKICKYCKAEVPAKKEFCPTCGNKYQPLTCENCQTKIHASTDFCPNCGQRVKSEKEKKKIKTVLISAAILILACCLILFVPYNQYVGCPNPDCVNGVVECGDKKAAEYLSGKPVYGHDCDRCEYGKAPCTSCNGEGGRYQKISNFNMWF